MPLHEQLSARSSWWLRPLSWLVVAATVILLGACSAAGAGEVTVSGVAHWGNEFGEGGSVFAVANKTSDDVEVVAVTLPSDSATEVGFVIVDVGQEVGGNTGARVLPPEQLAPLPLTIAPGELAELHVVLELRSCDAAGDWYVDPEEQIVSFRTTTFSSFEVHFADRETQLTDTVPPMGTMLSLQPEVCGA